jgi:hypothetical protein
MKPPPDLRCCGNCTRWETLDYIHCYASGPWGQECMSGHPECKFEMKDTSKTEKEIT